MDITDSPHQFHFGTARHAHLSLTLASYRPLDPVPSLPAPKSDSEHRGTLRSKSDDPGATRAARTKDHTQARGYISAILRTRRQPALRRRRRRNRRSAAISASSRSRSHSSSLISSLLSLRSLALPMPLLLPLSFPPPRDDLSLGRDFLHSMSDSASEPHRAQSARETHATPRRRIIPRKGETLTRQDDARTVNRARKRDACTPTTTRSASSLRSL